ncbi:hypothetical protein F5Y14DRAFT_450369 [Nemania sp. NC0429]|nr:hypothetical protein F5Y14DRAFT_450369 [Nemania sp. NC0429]
MRRYRGSRGLMQLAQLLFIASTVSAVSLQDFQDITIVQVPSLSCLGAYGSRIHGCSRRDFRGNDRCSDRCAEGIQQEQANVIAACKNIAVNDKSLLGLALQGGLLDALCPNFQTPSMTPIPSQTFSTIIPPQTFSTISPTQETSTSTTSTAQSSPTPTTATSESSESSTTISSTPSESDTPVVSSTPTEATTSIPLTRPPAPTPTADNQDEKPDRGSSGGGSPFDPVFAGGTESMSQTSISMLALLTGTLITALLLG